MGNHLNSLLRDAVNRIHDLSCGTIDDFCENVADKQIDLLQRRAYGLRRMMLGWIQTATPHPPFCAIVDVASTNSITIRIQEASEGAITTKFKGKFFERRIL